MSGYIGRDEDGTLYTFDLWCEFAGWDGGTIHDALRAFRGLPLHEKDRFCGMLSDAIDKDQLKDLASGWAAEFTRARLGKMEIIR